MYAIDIKYTRGFLPGDTVGLFPEGYEAYSGVDGAALVTPESLSDHNDNDAARGPLRYDGIAIDIADIGVFFAYPWPEEHELM
jgi:hypothetical protein